MPFFSYIVWVISLSIIIQGLSLDALDALGNDEKRKSMLAIKLNRKIEYHFIRPVRHFYYMPYSKEIPFPY